MSLWCCFSIRHQIGVLHESFRLLNNRSAERKISQEFFAAVRPLLVSLRSTAALAHPIEQVSIFPPEKSPTNSSGRQKHSSVYFIFMQSPCSNPYCGQTEWKGWLIHYISRGVFSNAFNSWYCHLRPFITKNNQYLML